MTKAVREGGFFFDQRFGGDFLVWRSVALPRVVDRLKKSRRERLKSRQQSFRMRGSTGMSSDAQEFAVAMVAGVLERKIVVVSG